MERTPTRRGTHVLWAALSIFVVSGALWATVPPTVAQVLTCNGEAATVTGPTQGHDTTGTEGDDVIVAPISFDSTVSGLGGNDTICLVDGGPELSDRTQIKVRAGAGNDTVLNESTSNPAFWSRVLIELGTGADHFVGADYGESVFGADATGAGSDNDTEVDTVNPSGGEDVVVSGTDVVDSPNADVIATGPGRDTVWYAGLAGSTIDNGAGSDNLVLRGAWTGRLDIDNVAEHANLGDTTVLTWTAVNHFYLSAQPGSLVSFAGSEVGEVVNVSGTVAGLEATGASIVTGGGEDQVRLEDYLPTAVDLGSGHDTLSYRSCYRAVIRLPGRAACTTRDGREVVTTLAGVDVLLASASNSLTVIGSDQGDIIDASSRLVRVDSRRGDDRVAAKGRDVLAKGGRGNDKLKSSSGGTTFYGGRGDDVLRGGMNRDLLFGGPGHDIAKGKGSVDVCVAEVRIDCERR